MQAESAEESVGGSPPATLRSLVDAIGFAVVRILAAPEGLDVPVLDITIHDPLGPPTAHEGDVVLAVGVDPERPEAINLIAAAGRGDAAAVVLKTRDRDAAPAAAIDAAGSSGVALVAVDPEMAWSQLHAVLRTARAASGGADAYGLAAVGDLFTLANAVAAMVGGPTTIEDPQSVVLAFSSLDEPIDEPRRRTILGRRVPDEWVRRLRDDGVFRALWSSEGPIAVDYSKDGLKKRLAVAVRAGDEILGSIWVAEGDRPLGAGAASALEEAAAIAALHMLRHRAGDDLARRRRAELVEAVLDGRSPPSLVADALGIALDGAATVIALALPAGEAAAVAATSARVVALVGLFCEAYRRDAVSVNVGRYVYAIVPGVAGRESLAELSEQLVARAEEALGVELRAGIGPTVSLAELQSSRQGADDAVRALEGETRVAAIEAVQERVVLRRLVETVSRDPALQAGKLAALIEHDRAHNSAFVATLRAWLDASGDVPGAAAAADVHPNTFRYRLRRLSEVAGLNLDDPVTRIVLHLQLLASEA